MTPEEQSVKIEQLEEAIKEMKQKDKEFRKEVFVRLREYENQQARTDERYNAIIETQARQGRQLAEIIDTLNELRNKPAERWDTAVKTIITGIVSAFIGVVLGKGL